MNVVTAGVYLTIGERFLFVFGPNPAGDRLAIVRVGGHREPGETAWECAAREALEETGLTIEALPVSTGPDWHEPGPRPLLVLPRDTGVTVMFLARAEGAPQPCSEVQGLLLLSREEILALCAQPTTLQAFLDAGGQAWMRRPYPPEMILEPVLQCRLLARLLADRHLT
ncbi:MAG TPA: NUDIX domain-containing protein [Symbiobacteriaceae bacterium]|nr:NUDIX domain-containing protein [Symbiobacteriaceae bacterium]